MTEVMVLFLVLALCGAFTRANAQMVVGCRLSVSTDPCSIGKPVYLEDSRSTDMCVKVTGMCKTNPPSCEMTTCSHLTPLVWVKATVSGRSCTATCATSGVGGCESAGMDYIRTAARMDALNNLLGPVSCTNFEGTNSVYPLHDENLNRCFYLSSSSSSSCTANFPASADAFRYCCCGPAEDCIAQIGV